TTWRGESWGVGKWCSTPGDGCVGDGCDAAAVVLSGECTNEGSCEGEGEGKGEWESGKWEGEDV
ncbi:hypothetical protein Tco_0675257, partial [Tanacetum coccineum]